MSTNKRRIATGSISGIGTGLVINYAKEYMELSLNSAISIVKSLITPLILIFLIINSAVCNAKDLDDQCDLASKYLNGKGVELNYEKARQLYIKAAESGSARAQNELGIIYVEGKGVERNCSESVKWFNKAVKQNYSKAKYNLALKYYSGTCVDKDIKKAVKLYSECGSAGIFACMKNAAIIYFNDFNDPVNAFKWSLKAAETGDDHFQKQVGMMYLSGTGVEKNVRKASYWLRQSAAQNNQEAIKIIMSRGL